MAVMADPVLLKVLSIMAGVMHRKGLRIMESPRLNNVEDMVHPPQSNADMVVRTAPPLQSNADTVPPR
jgi:hypothetical protein